MVNLLKGLHLENGLLVQKQVALLPDLKELMRFTIRYCRIGALCPYFLLLGEFLCLM
jgi:hypothetical protein